MKPKDIKEVISSLDIVSGSILVSLAAGVSTDTLYKQAQNKHFSLIRIMPNTPSEIGQGVAVCYGKDINETQRQVIDRLMQQTGSVYWIDSEEQLHIVTAISGSGPAYIFEIARILIETAKKQGLDERIATPIILNMIKGSAEYALLKGSDLERLRDNVTSKGGTTEAALNILKPNLQDLLSSAIKAALERSKELSSL